ncbi:maleylpyruvate isomerase family mycothiol-dependent enzyme [Streptomyces corynorhini]|uniref:Maleylpyruvate isomerase family mycothiol-dependent enzyme n=1 Tax=Streptomyces corynorhini TaxID=2282652 RepID=A0A370B8E6_9ACTN|nr:maleylpyruvate isomerase family mycothiol-dependent enzyme [Streptomyces corynorhini]RDG36016.1 maleylpyruvate isomerase family mycothiol-dependent enzyme [Streptomyces corynorhini]
MDRAELLGQLTREGGLLADAALEAGPDTRVAACPGWRIRDVLRHTGQVHRWATAFVAEGHTSPRAPGGAPDLDGDALVEWFREGHALLVTALATAPDDLECWTFLPAPTPLAFWTRRQAHETAVHRVDAESPPAPTVPTPLDPGFAADGIDELLRCFHVRARSRVRSEAARVLRVRATDTDDVWTVRISREPVRTTRTRAAEGDTVPADCELSGPAGTLQLTLWNRLPLDAVALTGDRAVALLWRETSAVVMS